MQTTRITVSVPDHFYEDLRLIAYEQNRSISSVLVEKAMAGPKKVNRNEDDLAFFKKVANSGVQINTVKALRAERNRDNA